MIKQIILCSILISLCGCATNSRPPVTGEAPKGLVKLMADDKIITYADFRIVSSYQGNPRLRQFYMINNHTVPTLIRKKPKIYITSSRTINIVNCDKYQIARFEHIYFSLPYAQGDAVAKTKAFGQWESFNKISLIGMITDMLCNIPPERLKPQPPKDTSNLLLGEFEI